MIKHTVIFSILLVSTQTLASTPCPTCPKGYVTSSLEDVLVSQIQKTQTQSNKKFAKNSHPSLDSAKEKSTKTPVQVVATLTDQIKPQEKPKRRERSFEEELMMRQEPSRAIEAKARRELIERPSMLNKENYYKYRNPNTRGS